LKAESSPVKFAALVFFEKFNWAGKAQSGPQARLSRIHRLPRRTEDGRFGNYGIYASSFSSIENITW
ncbi:MAG: hypothetical protein KAI93_12750, partial [Desulfobacterales bacterium]|nr:hypothetical protein [Desulfobacterales bacterium]